MNLRARTHATHVRPLRALLPPCPSAPRHHRRPPKIFPLSMRNSAATHSSTTRSNTACATRRKSFSVRRRSTSKRRPLSSVRCCHPVTHLQVCADVARAASSCGCALTVKCLVRVTHDTVWHAQRKPRLLGLPGEPPRVPCARSSTRPRHTPPLLLVCCLAATICLAAAAPRVALVAACLGVAALRRPQEGCSATQPNRAEVLACSEVRMSSAPVTLKAAITRPHLAPTLTLCVREPSWQARPLQPQAARCLVVSLPPLPSSAVLLPKRQLLPRRRTTRRRWTCFCRESTTPQCRRRV